MYTRHVEAVTALGVCSLLVAVGTTLTGASRFAPGYSAPPPTQYATAVVAPIETRTPDMPIPESAVANRTAPKPMDARALPSMDDGICPFSADETTYVVDFTRGGSVPPEDRTLTGGPSAPTISAPASSSVVPASYAVTVAYMGIDVGAQVEHDLGSRWRIDLYDEGGTKVAETAFTRMSRGGETAVLEEVGVLVVDRAVSRALAVHAEELAAPTPGVIPVCAKLELLPSSEDVVSTPAPDSDRAAAPMCPLAKRDNRILVDFTTLPGEGVVRADRGSTEAVLESVPVHIPAGVYTVRFAGMRPIGDEVALDDAWYVTLFDNDGASLVQTGQSAGIPAWENGVFVTKAPEPYTIPGVATRIVAHHAAFPSVLAGAVVPVCVSFDPVNE